MARLWQLNKHTLSRGLTERGMTTRRGSNYAIPLNPAVAAFGRDALAKMVTRTRTRTRTRARTRTRTLT